ncbi:MAG: hypothetical protein IPL07_22465 [Acidimicrobiaceae bacterium]|nr:hypothetical protein [Acidimicrobiaceae bacterium]
MRVRFAVLVAVTSVLTVVSPAAAGRQPNAAHSASIDWAYVQHEVYEVPLRLRRHRHHRRSVVRLEQRRLLGTVGGRHRVVVQLPRPCRRHDFGYRNLKLIDMRYGNGVWNGTNRRRVDQQFLADMKAHCRTRAFTLQAQCYTWAQTFYAAVRVAGGP